MPSQITLDLSFPLQQSFDNFILGDNAELLTALKSSPNLIWISGPSGSGKTHLLRGAARHAGKQGRTTSFVPCAHPSNEVAEALDLAAQFGDVVLVDDVAHIAGHSEMERALLASYERLKASGGDLIISHQNAAAAIDFGLQDLNSRCRSLLHYGVAALDDEGKAQLLRERASHHGYDLSDAVVDYWLFRGPRDVGALLTDLSRLDRASLSRHRQVTIPLLKEELGY